MIARQSASLQSEEKRRVKEHMRMDARFSQESSAKNPNLRGRRRRLKSGAG